MYSFNIYHISEANGLIGWHKKELSTTSTTIHVIEQLGCPSHTMKNCHAANPSVDFCGFTFHGAVNLPWSIPAWWFQPLWKIWKSMKWEGLSYYGKHVSNHQPDMITIRSNMLWWWKSPHLVQWFSQLEASSSVQRRLTSGGQGYPSISHQVSKPRPNHPLNKQCQLLKLLKHPKNHHQSPTCFIFFPSYLVMYLSLLAKFGSGHQGVAWGPRLEAKACTAWRSFHGRHGRHGEKHVPSIRLRKYQTVISPRTLVTAWWPKRCLRHRDVHKRQGYPSDIMTKYRICIHKMYVINLD